MSNIQEVFRGTTNNWDVRMRYQNTWQFIIAIDHTFGFDSSTQSSIDITIDIPISNTQELVFGFTKDNKEYISISIPLINSGGSNKIFPACNQLAGFMPFAFGDIASIPTFNRVCDIAENSCTNWKNMLPPNSETIKSPITFTLENDPSNNQLIFYFQSQTISNTEILQTCKFDVGTNFKTNNGLKIYMAGGYPGETYSINSIDITSYIKIPTVSPTKAPTNIPSISPTKNPSISPTFHPTNNPSITPTNQPTKSPSHNPSITPSKFPSYNPSISPTNRPTVNTPAPITTRPTYNPSFQPTNNPIRATLKPTNNPITIRPSMNPVRATPIGFQYGNYGQLCANNNINNQCEIQSNILSNMNILCATPYECCMCKTIQCGINNTPCNQFLVTSDYAMYGVKDIHIIGNNGNIYSTNGVSIDCKGIQSCKNTNIIASGINYIDCDGNNACQMAVIQITNPKNGFHLECNGVESCAGLQIEIILSGPPGGYYCNPNRAQEIFQFSKIACNNNNACDGLEIIIKNEGCDRVIIQDLECIQPNACNNAIFNLIGDVRIDNCLCVSCNTAIGLNQCWNNLDNYICSDRRSCNTANGSTLLVFIDNKSNIPTVQASLPSSFAIQQPLPLIQQQPLSIPNISSITNTIPNIQFQNYNISNTTNNISIINKSSKLNPSAPSFTPYTPYTTMQPIAETDHEINDINEIKLNDNNNKDQWCIYDDNDTQKQQQQQQHYNAKKEIFKPNKRFHNYNKDKRPFHKNWRNNNHNNDNYINTTKWRNNRYNNHNKTIKLLAVFIKHVTLPNRHQYPPNTLLTKTWAMRNCGETEWGYNVELVYCKGDENLSLHNRYPVKNAQSGEEIEISANIKTPQKPGRYCTYFRLQKYGKFFGPRVWVDIIVKSLDEMDNNITNNCGNQNKHINDAQKAIKWKKKYASHNHYKVVSCK